MRNLRSEQDILKNWEGDISIPLVSIHCLAYNHEPYIEDALEGFLIQETSFPFEILIHDDASTDKTAAIIREYEAKYPKLIKPIYQTENQWTKGNKPGRINKDRAKGKYIAYCEGDDFWTDPKKLQIQVEFLEAHLDYVITYHDCISFDKNGISSKHTHATKHDLSKDDLKKAPAIHTRTVCFRNCLHSYPPEQDTARIGDQFLWSMLGEYGKGKYLNNIKPSYYRIHDGGIFSNASSNISFDMTLSTMSALFCYYRRKGDLDTSKYFAERIIPRLIKVIGLKRFIVIIPKIFLGIVKTKIFFSANGK